jgi:hypothetical protein
MLNLIKEEISLPQTFSATSDIEEARNALVLEAQKVTSITNAWEQTTAANRGREIRRWIKQVEEMRVELTAPLLIGQRLIKALADDHVAPLMGELKRLERLAMDFQESENRRVALEQERQRKEFERLEAIRIEAEQKARAETERIRLENEAAEAKAKAAEAKIESESDLEKAIEAEELRKENESVRLAEIEERAEQAREALLAVQTQLRQPLPEVIKARGQSVRARLCFEVLDAIAVFKARPELCEVTVKPSAVQACCKATDVIPGLRLWSENRSTFSSR